VSLGVDGRDTPPTESGAEIGPQNAKVSDLSPDDCFSGYQKVGPATPNPKPRVRLGKLAQRSSNKTKRSHPVLVATDEDGGRKTPFLVIEFHRAFGCGTMQRSVAHIQPED